MKNCPYCGAEIQDEAVRCKHCRESIMDQEKAVSLDNQIADPSTFGPQAKVSWTIIALFFSILAVTGIVVFVLAVTSRPVTSSPAPKTSSIDPRLIHPENDEKAEHALAVEELESAGVIKSLKTSLRGGPEPQVIVKILEKWVKSNASIRLYSDNEKEGMVVTKNTIKRAKISNEYTRTIDSETIFFYDFQLEVNTSYGAGSTEVSCSFVKRGKGWYLYSANGRRMENF